MPLLPVHAVQTPLGPAGRSCPGSDGDHMSASLRDGTTFVATSFRNPRRGSESSRHGLPLTRTDGHPVPVGVAVAAPPERLPGGRVAPMYARSTTIQGD